MSENILLILVLWPLLAAVLGMIIGFFSDKARNLFVAVAVVVEFLLMLYVAPSFSNEAPPVYLWDGLFGVPLHFTLDGFRVVYGLITSFMWMMTGLFSQEYFKDHNDNLNRYYFFYLLTLGATMGVMLSGNLWTTFVFFEVMSITSYVLVLHDENRKAIRAANVFLAVGVIGGLFMLIGLFMMQHYIGTTEMSLIVDAVANYEGPKNILYAIGILMTIGFGGKAGMFPLHFWLPMAHPVAPAPASALLSGILTKAGVFGLLIIGGNILLHDHQMGLFFLILGAITMFLGAFRALFSMDLKEILALSSVSQIGFIVVGIGMQGLLGDHNAIAVRGTILHMVNHSLIKLVLFMAAGAIYMKLHKLHLNDLQGYGKNKPILKAIFALGALSLMSVPLFSGYVSKTLIHEAIVEYIWLFTGYSSVSFFYQFIEALFILSGGFTVAYMLKVFIAIFVEEHPYAQEEHEKFNNDYLSPVGMFALGVPAVMLLIMGVFPGIIDYIADIAQPFVNGQAPAHAVNYFSWINLRGGLTSIVIGVIVYFTLIRNILMEEDEQGNERYVIRNLGFIMTFLANLGKRISVGIFEAIGVVTNFISILPGFIATELLGLHRWGEKKYSAPIENQKGISYYEKDDYNKERPTADRLLTSSLGFGLLQVTFALVLIIIIVFALQ